jgi:hypothetical protein
MKMRIIKTLEMDLNFFPAILKLSLKLYRALNFELFFTKSIKIDGIKNKF